MLVEFALAHLSRNLSELACIWESILLLTEPAPAPPSSTPAAPATSTASRPSTCALASVSRPPPPPPPKPIAPRRRRLPPLVAALVMTTTTSAASMPRRRKMLLWPRQLVGMIMEKREGVVALSSADRLYIASDLYRTLHSPVSYIGNDNSPMSPHVRRSVDRLVGPLVCLFVCYNLRFHFPCSYRSTCFI